MRKLLFVLLFAAFATPLKAQQLASVQVTAYIRIPDFLSLRTSTPTVVDENTRRMTVYVTANRTWQLNALPKSERCMASEIHVVEAGGTDAVATGRNGNDLPVVIEYECRGESPPDSDDLEFVLVAG